MSNSLCRSIIESGQQFVAIANTYVLCKLILGDNNSDVVVVALLFYVHSKHLRSCRDGQLT